jgi:hypothetical protein
MRKVLAQCTVSAARVQLRAGHFYVRTADHWNQVTAAHLDGP